MYQLCVCVCWILHKKGHSLFMFIVFGDWNQLSGHQNKYTSVTLTEMFNVQIVWNCFFFKHHTLTSCITLNRLPRKRKKYPKHCFAWSPRLPRRRIPQLSIPTMWIWQAFLKQVHVRYMGIKCYSTFSDICITRALAHHSCSCLLCAIWFIAFCDSDWLLAASGRVCGGG